MAKGAPRSSLEPILTAVYGALSTAPSVTALAPVYNNVPQGTARPYLVIENPTEVPWNTMGEFGKDVTLQLHAVVETAGDLAALRLLNAAIAVLDYAKPLLADHQCVSLKYEHGATFTEELVGGILLRHHVAVLRVLVTQLSVGFDPAVFDGRAFSL